MLDLYLITRLNGIIAFALILIIVCVVRFLCYLSSKENDYEDPLGNKFKKSAIVTLIISIAIVIFVPSTKEAYMIYGIGGTIDYVKSNDIAKKLPDKVILAIDKYLDKINNNK